MITTQEEAVRGYVMKAFDQLSAEQICELLTAPYFDLQESLLVPKIAA